jgi:hypothetical protein
MLTRQVTNGFIRIFQWDNPLAVAYGTQSASELPVIPMLAADGIATVWRPAAGVGRR